MSNSAIKNGSKLQKIKKSEDDSYFYYYFGLTKDISVFFLVDITI